jgi:hypothetical protein
MLLKERSKGREDEEEDFSSYRVKLGNGSYWKLKEEAADHAPWRTIFGKVCGHVVRQLLDDCDLFKRRYPKFSCVMLNCFFSLGLYIQDIKCATVVMGDRGEILQIYLRFHVTCLLFLSDLNQNYIILHYID